jgi:hypothetical protein
MKKNQAAKLYEGLISLDIAPTDTIAWKLLMLIEAATTKEEQHVGDIASKYGYTREYFYHVFNSFKNSGSKGLIDKPKGPQKNYRRTKEIEKQIIRHRFLDPEANSEVIAQKMKQSGYNISQRSVERTINEYCLQKRGYIKQIRITRFKKSPYRKPKEKK